MGILSLRNHRYHPNRRLMEAARAQGHGAMLLHPARVYLTVTPMGFRVGHLKKAVLPEVVLPRVGSTILEYPLALLRHMEGMGIRMVNNSEAVARARNKFRVLQALARQEVPIPESCYASNERNLAAAARELGSRPFVIKTAQGRQGRGVFLVKDAGGALRLFRERPPALGQGLVLQEFVPPEDRRRDIRVLVMGGRAVAAMALRPRRGEFRANVHLHGRAEALPLSKSMEHVAVKATAAVGLDIAGVDMIQKADDTLLVVDVNYSPGFKGLEKCTGVDIAARIIAFTASFLESGQGGSIESRTGAKP